MNEKNLIDELTRKLVAIEKENKKLIELTCYIDISTKKRIYRNYITCVSACDKLYKLGFWADETRELYEQFKFLSRIFINMLHSATI